MDRFVGLAMSSRSDSKETTASDSGDYTDMPPLIDDDSDDDGDPPDLVDDDDNDSGQDSDSSTSTSLLVSSRHDMLAPYYYIKM